MPDPRPLTDLRDMLLVREPGATALDDETWNDLDLGEVFASLNKCASVLGSLSLYRWLRSPIRAQTEVPTLHARVAAGDALEAARPAWVSVVEHLEQLPWLPLLLLEVLMGTTQLPTLGVTPTALAVLALLSPLGFLVSVKVGVLLALAMFAVNMGYHFWASRKVDQALGSLSFVGVLLGAAKQAARVKLPGLEATSARLEVLTRQLAPLSRASADATFPPVVDDFPGEHLRIFYLTRERRLSRCAVLITQHRAALLEMMDLLGDLDAAWTVGVFRRGVATCTPVFEGQVLEVIAGRHPSLERAIPNDVRLEGGLVITGSNMSGKSTFLRMLALNSLFAQSLGFVCAKSYRAPLVMVGTSLRAHDHLAEGQSTYSAEALRLRTLLERAGSTPKALFLIDEPFRGTNSAERIAAGVAVLRHLRRLGALVVAATHDLEVSRLLDATYAHGYFVDTVEADGLHFDYRLHTGFAGPKNAIRLLAVLGYPREVIEDATALLPSP